MHTRVNPDDVPLLWTQSPRFIQIMRSGSELQHPQYFFAQTDKLTALLHRLFEDINTFGPCDGYSHAQDVLTKLLNESQTFSGLTREDLRQLEPHVRAFVEELNNVDSYVEELDERRRMMNMKSAAKKRGRSNDEDEEIASSFKKRRETCGSELMDFGSAIDATTANMSPWMQLPFAQPVAWNEPFSNWT